MHEVSYFTGSRLSSLLLILFETFSNIFLSIILGIIYIIKITKTTINIGDKIYGNFDSFSTSSSFNLI